MILRTTAREASCILALGLAAGLAPTAARAQAANDKWEWEASIYGWLPAIGGTTSFPSGKGGPSVDVSAEDVIGKLKMTFMGQIEARKNSWGVWSDVVYADLGGSKDGIRRFTVDHQPVAAPANVGLDVKSTVWTLAGLYNLATTFENRTDLLFGTRLLDMEQTLNWTLSNNIPQLPATVGSSSAGLTNWDAVVGVKGRYYFGAERRWFLPYYVDIGTGESKFTWQLNAGVGYRFDWGSVFATYRHLDYQFKSGIPIQTMTMSGPVFGAAYQW